MDGDALVNMIKPSVEDKTFAEYASNTFAQYVSAQLQHVKRIDIVWDEYVEASLKANHSAQTLTGCAATSCTWNQATKKLEGVPARWAQQARIIQAPCSVCRVYPLQ